MAFTNREKLISFLSLRAGTEFDDVNFFDYISKYLNLKILDKENDLICDEIQELLKEMKEINLSVVKKNKKEKLTSK